ncbi:MAG: DsbA family oxidoreductase [Acetobacteraceae bacterium]|nr:DsbA family oxidoreductase [Acetobacteraceae bacterium]
MTDDRIPEDATGAVCTAEGCEPGATGAATESASALPADNAGSAGRLDVVSDAICPWCWIGKRQLDLALAELAARDGLHFEVRWLPFQLNPGMPPEGVDRQRYRERKFGSLERSRQLDAQVAEAGRAVGLEFRHDRMTRTPNTVEAHRLIYLAEPTGLQGAVVEAIFQAYFHDGRDIGDRATLAAIGAEAGLDAATLDAFTEGFAAREEVLTEDHALRSAGLSGVPSFVLDRHLLFSGAVPAAQMAAALRHAHRVLAERRREAAGAQAG